ncbi:TIGR03118 family protein [Nocardia cyriacigeorgica]|uniref:TIGR03118 family protein n=1 Tax=Nocardia cyriacigeorgica TaxID=135487 RepID=UPI0013BCB385|nr:TIGR03118 family protein [Nocardia cyriacigeorgica]NEW49751.1 TIGR03118 family protein [Nocardia cyriacigeorgica]
MLYGHRADSGNWRSRTALLRVSALGAVLVVAAACSDAGSRPDDVALDGNRYVLTALAAGDDDAHAAVTVSELVNAWGFADRAGGHFLVGAGGKAFGFLGDVRSADKPELHTLSQDGFVAMTVPGADSDTSDKSAGTVTGVVANPAPPNSDVFVVRDQPVPFEGLPPLLLTGSARNIIATDSGKISAWTDVAPDGAVIRHDGPANLVFDGSAQQMAFYGIALAPSGDTLLAADFGAEPQVRTFDKNWQLVATAGFANPFATGEAVDADKPELGRTPVPGDLAPFNITVVGDRVFVSYAVTRPHADDTEKFAVGEREVVDADGSAADEPAKGKVAEFAADGTLVRILDDGGRLNAPWAVTVTPSTFGPLSGKLLIGNTGGAGRILAYDDTTGKFVDYVRDTAGAPLSVPGLRGLEFGNGASLGDSDALYLTAAPTPETAHFSSVRLK